ncbi:3-oxoacyl-ACP reductase FabG [Nocardia sp. NBC_00881]|uniref:3-oxoacyl-ACP reductase FabG n=1 Tax=Nocardia sp. NBC_00881 TaxID=2975995 RepID=UPI0038674F05|nr:3-oxoacyl-ACP reductase FabG [Nocardia sp. NBC_00881]
MELLKGKVAVVTGAAQGLGLAIARLFTEQGARVVLADLNIESARREAAALDGAAVRCDVTDAGDVDALIGTAVEKFGALDIMVNNAGITRDKTIGKMTPDEFRTVVDVHLYGAWLGTRAAMAVMRGQGAGAIVNMSSISGKVGNFGQTNYSAAKAGIVGLTKAAAKEGAARGIRVNAIQPGLIRTAMTEAMPKDAWDSKMAEIPMRRAGEPAEVASAALFLASGLSSYITGTVIEVTGGRHI